MKGWWCLRFGAALEWVEAPSGEAAVRRSLELHPLDDWTDDARQLVAFPQYAYPEHSRPHNYTRAVLGADPSSRARRRAARRGAPLALACLVVAPCPRSRRRCLRATLGRGRTVRS